MSWLLHEGLAALDSEYLDRVVGEKASAAAHARQRGVVVGRVGVALEAGLRAARAQARLHLRLAPAERAARAIACAPLRDLIAGTEAEAGTVHRVVLSPVLKKSGSRRLHRRRRCGDPHPQRGKGQEESKCCELQIMFPFPL